MLSAIVTSNYTDSKSVQKAFDICNIKTLIYQTDFSISDRYDFTYHDGIFVHLINPTERHINFCLHLKNLSPGKTIFLLVESDDIDFLEHLNSAVNLPVFLSPFAFRNISGVYQSLAAFELDYPYKYKKDGLSLTLNSSKRELCVGDRKIIRLINKEFFIMKFLFTHRGQIVSKLDLFEFVWGKSLLTSTGTIDVHMSKLRKKLKKYLKVDLIKTIHSAGYIVD